jgi:hypothetical protein
MNKDLIKGLLFFAGGFIVARYLMKNTLLVDNTPFCGAGTHLDTATGKCVPDDPTAANESNTVATIVDNVSGWLKTNYPELSDTEAQTYAQQATGVDTTANADGSNVVNVNIQNTPQPQQTQGHPDIINIDNPTYVERGYPAGNILLRSPNANDMKMATGDGMDGVFKNSMGAVQSDFTWSFN